MNGNIRIEDIDKALLGMELIMATVLRLVETSDFIKEGGEGGISDENLASVKERAATSFAEFDALVDKLSGKRT